MTLPAGTRLGPYEIVAPLGAGGMGEVYRARDTRLERDVAIKVLPESFSADADRLRRFEQEARAVAALNHPNILAVHDVGVDGGVHYLVTELLEGEPLRGKLSAGPLGLRRAGEYALQIANGLAAAHERGIVHRDLKPENIFVTRDARVKILDFGLAKQTAAVAAAGADATLGSLMPEKTAPGIVLGTAGYMAPEQVRGKPADHRSDLFAFGAVLYEMLSGRRAFQRGTTVETMTAILNDDPQELNASGVQVAPALDRIVRRCMEKEPEQRFQSAKDLAFALEAISTSSSSTHATADTPAAKTTRVWSMAVVAIAVVVLIGAGVMAGLRLSRQAPPRFDQIVYQQGMIDRARLGPDGKTLFYSAEWRPGDREVYSSDPTNPAGRSLGIPGAALLSVSNKGEIALLLDTQSQANAHPGVLAILPSSGGAPHRIVDAVQDADWSPDGSSMAIAHYDAATQSCRLEYPIGTILYQNSGYISDVRVSPDGQRVAFMDHPVYGDDNGTVAVVDKSGHKTTLTPFYQGERGLAWSASGKEIWFTNNLIAVLQVVDLSGKVRPVYYGPGRLVLDDIGPAGEAMAHNNSSREGMAAIGPGAAGEVRELTWLDYSYVTGISRDGRLVLFGEEGAGGGPEYSAYVRPADGSPALRIGAGTPTDVSPDKQWAILLTGGSEVRLSLAPLGVGEPRPLDVGKLKVVVYPYCAAFSPDGKSVLFEAREPGHGVRVYRLDVRGGNPSPITPEGFGSPHLSRDGKTLLAIHGNRWELLPLGGGEPTPVKGIEANDAVLSWSEDGQIWLAHTDSARRASILKLNPATGARRAWRELPSFNGFYFSTAVVSPDGGTIAFSYDVSFDTLFRISGLR